MINFEFDYREKESVEEMKLLYNKDSLSEPLTYFNPYAVCISIIKICYVQ